MRSLLLLVPISLVLLGVAIWAFVWAVRRGQFDDLDTPALDILADDGDEDGNGLREARPAKPGHDPHSNPQETTATAQRDPGAGPRDAD